MTEPGELETTLERLTRSTDAIGPGLGFAERVMSALPAPGSSWMNVVLRSSRRVVPAALIVAVLTAVWAARSSSGVDESLAASYGSMELDW